MPPESNGDGKYHLRIEDVPAKIIEALLLTWDIIAGSYIPQNYGQLLEALKEHPVEVKIGVETYRGLFISRARAIIFYDIAFNDPIGYLSPHNVRMPRGSFYTLSGNGGVEKSIKLAEKNLEELEEELNKLNIPFEKFPYRILA